MKTKENLQHIKMVRMVNKWMRQNKVKRCPDCHGLPMSNLTVVPKSYRHNGITI